MIRFVLTCASLIAALLTAPLPARAADAAKLAVFDFELIDTSLEGELQGERPDQQQRLVMISEKLRQMLAERGGYEIADIAPVADAVAKAGLLHGCNGCAADIAKPLGAKLALSGTVQKVSNLILNINVFVWDTASGAERFRTSVDIRGNTDESWAHGISYLVRNNLLEPLAKIAAE